MVISGTKGTLIIFRSVPGAGKSTAAQLLASAGGFPVFEADQYWTEERPWHPDLLSQAHFECQENVRKAMEQCQEMIFLANTNTTEKEIEVYIQMAKENGYAYVSLVVENRSETSSVHGVPEESLKKMEQRLRGSIKLR